MPRFPSRSFLAAALLAAGIAPAFGQDAPAKAPLTEAERAAIEEVVRDYLLENPELIVEVLNLVRERQKAAQDEQIFRDPASPVAGNPDGDVTLVEFFDYQCAYCKAVLPNVQQLLKEDGQLRFVFKEFPILGAASITAAKAALAAREQDRYLEMHNALMGHRGQLSDARIFEIAESVGLDLDRLKADMESDGVKRQIADNLRLAESLGIKGTPGFIVGERIIPGALPLDLLKELVATERAS